MSDSIALEPSPRRDNGTTKPAARFSLGAMFSAFLESLVAANSRHFDSTDPLVYRFPPL